MSPHMSSQYGELRPTSGSFLHTKWHLDPSSHLATTYGPKIGGSAPPLGEGELGPHLTQCDQGRAYLHAKFHLDPSNRLATIHQRYKQDRTDRTTVRSQTVAQKSVKIS